VVFDIANIPKHLLYVDLRRELEICGMLSDVYVSKKHNVRGQIHGFVKFIKVCDVEKLNKPLNNVFFWDKLIISKGCHF
jgi:hypothetical protein